MPEPIKAHSPVWADIHDGVFQVWCGYCHDSAQVADVYSVMAWAKEHEEKVND